MKPSRRAGRAAKRVSGKWTRALNFVQVVLLVSFVLASIGVLFLGNRLRHVMAPLPRIADVDRDNGDATTVVYSADKDPATGKEFELGRVSDRFQETVEFKRIPLALKQATVAIEDERFYKHGGIDPWGIFRALVRNVEVQRLSEGASTITQQLVRNVLLTRRKTLDRKLAEAVLALQMERSLTKDRILEKYLNEVNYGGNIYGVGAAAKHYFGKDIGGLSISECALLAGLPQRPSATYPFRHPDAALRRRDVVLAKMTELGYLSRSQWGQERKREIVFLKNPPARRVKFRAPHFTNWVLRSLVKTLGKDKVYRGGLTIRTTLHWGLQQEAERLLREGVAAAADSGVTEGALVAMDPATGNVLAMVGSVDYDRVEYNYATGRSQPGSTFKPFVYAAAFETGKFTPESSEIDGPVTIGDWSPRNYGGRFSYSSMSLRSAVALSKNTIPVKVARAIGIDTVIGCARRLGIESPLNRDLTLALGTCQVSPLEMNSAYCAFANGGNRVSPNPIRQVTYSNGESEPLDAPVTQRSALPPTVVRRVDECLEAVVDYGTAAGSRDVRAVDNARGKTGTTSDNKDAWFIGYVPNLVTTVYVNGVRRSTKNGKTVVRYVPMQGVTGGQVCAPIWGKFLKAAIPLLQKSASTDPFANLQAGVEVAQGSSPKSVAATPVPAAASTPVGPEANPASVDAGQAPADNAPSREVGPASGSPDVSLHPPVVSTTPTPGIRSATGDTAAAGVTATGLPTISGSRPSAPVAPSLSRGPVLAPMLTETLICADNGLLANDYCPEALRRRLPQSKIPAKTCKAHGPRPDER